MLDVTVLAASTVEETAPLAGLDQPSYLNQMLAVRTGLAPHALLGRLHAIERAAGRERTARWASRTLDLDLVEMDGVTMSAPDLVLPHPGLADRDFWQRERLELRLLLLADGLPAPAPDVVLPEWAITLPKRRAHIARVAAVLDAWSAAMALPPAERSAWHDAGRWHDALRDADEPTLRTILPGAPDPFPLLHGPCAAHRLRCDGESRDAVLDAIAHHTTGRPDWTAVGRALYMADWLEPGRPFDRAERARLAARVPEDFDGVFAAVVERRVQRSAVEGRTLHPATRAMWEALR